MDSVSCSLMATILKPTGHHAKRKPKKETRRKPEADQIKRKPRGNHKETRRTPRPSQPEGHLNRVFLGTKRKHVRHPPDVLRRLGWLCDQLCGAAAQRRAASRAPGRSPAGPGGGGPGGEGELSAVRKSAVLDSVLVFSAVVTPSGPEEPAQRCWTRHFLVGSGLFWQD